MGSRMDLATTILARRRYLNGPLPLLEGHQIPVELCLYPVPGHIPDIHKILDTNKITDTRKIIDIHRNIDQELDHGWRPRRRFIKHPLQSCSDRSHILVGRVEGLMLPHQTESSHLLFRLSSLYLLKRTHLRNPACPHLQSDHLQVPGRKAKRRSRQANRYRRMEQCRRSRC